jgi:hypothetical protein
MDFSFTEEQTLLRNSIAKYLADTYAFDAWRKFTRGGLGPRSETLAAIRRARPAAPRCPRSMAARRRPSNP